MSFDVQTRADVEERAFERRPHIPGFGVRSVLDIRPEGGRLRVELAVYLHWTLSAALAHARDLRERAADWRRPRIWVEASWMPVRSLYGITHRHNRTRHIIHRARCRCRHCRARRLHAREGTPHPSV